jgi:glycopeptide antibiotics resistance protein
VRWLIAAGLYVLILLPALLAPFGRVHARAYLQEFMYRSASHAAADIAFNVAAFVPLGWCIRRGTRYLGLAPRASLGATVVAIALLSWSIETLQYFLTLRFSSILDVISNITGGLAGAVAASALARRS